MIEHCSYEPVESSCVRAQQYQHLVRLLFVRTVVRLDIGDTDKCLSSYRSIYSSSDHSLLCIL